jgi:hypothetical protein
MDIMANVLGDLNRLRHLPEGWDGEHAQRVSPAAAVVMARVIQSLIQDGSADPQLTPLADGGLSCEWLVGGDSVEVQVEPQLTWTLWIDTANGEEVLNEEFEHPGQGRAALAFARLFLEDISRRVRVRVPRFRD